MVGAYSEPLLDTITKRFKSNTRIVDKILHDVFAKPATVSVLKYQWCVPMVQSHRRLDTILDASVDDIVVVVNGLLIDRSTTEGQDTRPGQREAVDLDALSGQARNVFLVQIVVLSRVSTFSCLVVLVGLMETHIVSYVGSSIVYDVVCHTGQCVPNAGTTTFVLYCAFDLKGGTCDSPPGRL